MTTVPTRLTPMRRGRGYPAVEGLELRLYNAYQGLLSRAAWEALGSPEAVAIEYDDRGYSIVATTLADASAIRVRRHRTISTGVIAGALKGSVFPLRVTLVLEDGRLRFGDVA
jgi:hypothetical protein